METETHISGLVRKSWDWLFTRPAGPHSTWRIILWWEARRIPYNLIVGFAGIVSLVFFYFFILLSGILEPHEDAVEPLALVAAPFVVNFFYTAGWVVEIGIRPIRRSQNAGPLLLKIGLIFSLIVVALPSVCWGVYVLLQAAGVRP